MVYTVISPSNVGLCLNNPCTTYWYTSSDKCALLPLKMLVSVDPADSVAISVDFGGRGKVGNFCGGSDSYLTFSSPNAYTSVVEVDLWTAYGDGVWTSSVAVEVYISSNAVSNVNQVAYSDAGTFSTSGLSTGGFSAYGVCPTTIVYTITVADNGDVTLT